jgi:hypothetical protein
VNARIIYVLCGTGADGLERINRLGEMIYEKLLALPASISSSAKRFSPQIKEHLQALRMSDEWYRVIGGFESEGAIVVSQISEPVEWSPLLANRVANLVPVDRLEEVIGMVNSFTQTIGIYPETLKKALRDTLPLHGAQRMVSLGYAACGTGAGPQDAIEPLRRMCKWIADETCDPDTIPGMWVTSPIGATQTRS